MKAIIDDQGSIDQRIQEEYPLLPNSGNWIEKGSEHFQNLDEYRSEATTTLLAGGHITCSPANKVMAISGELMGQPLFVYAEINQPSTPCHFFRWVTNAIFGSKLAESDGLRSAKEPDQVVVPIHNKQPLHNVLARRTL